MPIALLADEKIEAWFEAGEYTKAREYITAQLEKTPKDPYLTYNLAITYYADGNYDEAIVLWEQATAVDDKKLRAKAMAQIGNASCRTADLIIAENRGDDASIHLRRAYRSLEKAVQQDGRLKMAKENFEYVSQRLVDHLVEQGRSKIEQSENQYVRGGRDLVLYRSSLADFEEALDIQPDNEEIQKLIDETSKLLAENLIESGEKSLEQAEEFLDKIKQDDKPITSEEQKDIYRTEYSLGQAIANLEDAASIRPEDPEVQAKVEEGRKAASKLKEKLADIQKNASEAHEADAAVKEERMDAIRDQLSQTKDKKEKNKLNKELSTLKREHRQDTSNEMRFAQQALDDYEEAVRLDPDNYEALLDKIELEKKLAKKAEDAADSFLEVAERSQNQVDSTEERIDALEAQMESADEAAMDKLQAELAQQQTRQAGSAQNVAKQLLSAKSKLEQATSLDATNESAQQKLDDTNDKLADVMEQAADAQLADAEMLEANGETDQSIAQLEQAIKNLGSAMAMTDDAGQMQGLQTKQDGAQAQLLESRGERASEKAAAQAAAQAALAQAAANQPGAQPPSDQQGNGQEQAAEYTEMVQFTEVKGKEEFGKFDTKAMTKAVKDW